MSTGETVSPRGSATPPAVLTERQWKAVGSVLAWAAPLAVLLVLRGTIGFNICDDAYISLKVASNFANGRGMTFNPGEANYVATSPLWVLLISALQHVTGSIVLAAKTLTVLCEALLVVTLVRFASGLPHGRWVGFFGALFLITNPVFLFTGGSGQEISLFLLAIVLAADLLRTGRSALALAAAAVAVWIRFEGVVLYVVVALWVWGSWGRVLKTSAAGLALRYLPSLAILAGFALFGLWVHGTVLPASVQRKLMESQTPFTGPWWVGAGAVLQEFWLTLLGKNTYWQRADTLSAALLLPMGIGLGYLVVRRRKETAALLAFTLLYVLGFVGGGALRAVHFPWYFVPVLPALSVAAGAGFVWILGRLSDGLAWFRDLRRYAVPEALFAAPWVVLMYFGSIRTDAEILNSGPVGTTEREKVYAAAALWAGQNLPPGSVVAAIEIGAIGFYLPPDFSVLDIYGLVRRKDEVRTAWMELLDRRPPEVVFSRAFFSYAKSINESRPGRYVWYRYRSLDIGIRSDLSRRLAPTLSDIQRMHETVDLSRDHVWPARSPAYRP